MFGESANKQLFSDGYFDLTIYSYKSYDGPAKDLAVRSVRYISSML